MISAGRGGSAHEGAGDGRLSAGSRLLPVLLLLLLLAAYSSVLPAGFIWDDDAYVLNNPHLWSPEGLLRIWFEPGATPQYYPLVFTFFRAQFQLWGVNPFGYHLVNILIHGANAMLLWRCLRRLEIPSSLLAVAIFALHPVHVESVAWITELKNVLSLFFCLLSFLCYWRFMEESRREGGRGRQWGFYGISLLFFICSLLSKTVSGSLPAAVLLLAWWKRRGSLGREALRLIPFFILAAVFGQQTARLEVTHVLARGGEWDFSPVDRLLIAGRAVWFYAGKLFWPDPLIFNYPRWQIDAGVWWQYLYPLGVLLLVGVLWLLRERVGRGALVAVLYFIGTLVPALGFFNVYPMRYSFVADHFQYAASIGLITLFCAAGARLADRLGWRSSVRLAAVTIVLILAALTWRQGRIYHDRMTLFSDTIAKNPRSWLSYTNRGRDYALAGRDDLALADLEKSLAINPADADALQMRGAIALKRGNSAAALADMDRSVALYPHRTDYLRNRSVANRYIGRPERALDDASKIIELAPEAVDGYLLRAEIYAALKNHAAARQDLAVLERLGYPLSREEAARILGDGGVRE